MNYNVFTTFTAAVVEITGVPAIGKSTVLNSIKREDAEQFVNDYIKLSQWKKILFNIFLLLKSISTLKSNDISWLWKSSFSVNASFLFRINIFRNCLLKFSYHDYLLNLNNTEVVFVDEGISHIPFLLQNQSNKKYVIREFYKRFESKLQTLNVVCIDGEVDTFRRLKYRGHKRLIDASDKDIKDFINMNKATLAIIKENSFVYRSFTIINVDD